MFSFMMTFVSFVYVPIFEGGGGGLNGACLESEAIRLSDTSSLSFSIPLCLSKTKLTLTHFLQLITFSLFYF